MKVMPQKNKYLLSLLALLLFANIAIAQKKNQKVVISFEKHGVKLKENIPFKIVFKFRDTTIIQNQIDGKFDVPNFKGADYIDVRICFKHKEVHFKYVHISKFGPDWTVGTDRRPFNKDLSRQGMGHYYKMQYLIFSDGTMISRLHCRYWFW